MGYRIAVYAFDLTYKTAILDAFGLTETDQPDTENESNFSGTALEGQYILWVNTDGRSLSDQAVAAAAMHCDVLVLFINETVMVAETRLIGRDGIRWSVLHNPDRGLEHIETTGTPPMDLDPLWAEKRAELRGDPDGGVDYVFDVPAILFERYAGVRYDTVHDLPFTELRSNQPERAKPFWKFW